jgi:V8-like Glu-specific endopeptidase
MDRPIPLDDPERLVYDIVQITQVPAPGRTDNGRDVLACTGTGFLIGGHLLVTCWHCVKAVPAEGYAYGVARQFPIPELVKMGGYWMEGIGRVGRSDLAIAKVPYLPSSNIQLRTTPARMGDEVWTFGYPLTSVRVDEKQRRYFLAHPRLFRGHILRSFVYDHPFDGATPSYELSFSAPEGLSGAPLFLAGTLDVIGVIYGTNDAIAIEERAQVDPQTGARTPETQRIVSFGLAHHTSTLLSAIAAPTDGRTLLDMRAELSHSTVPALLARSTAQGSFDHPGA